MKRLKYKIRKFLETNESKNTTFHNGGDVGKRTFKKEFYNDTDLPIKQKHLK